MRENEFSISRTKKRSYIGINGRKILTGTRIKMQTCRKPRTESINIKSRKRR